jgi:hypothetical protein
MRPNSQHRSFFSVVLATSAPPFQPLPHQRNICHPVANRFTQQTLPTVNRKHFFKNILYIESFCPQKTHTESCSSLVHSSSTVAIWLLKSTSEHAHVRPLPRLSWSSTVLLPSDTHRKPISSITAVLLPFVTYYWLFLVYRELTSKYFLLFTDTRHKDINAM